MNVGKGSLMQLNHARFRRVCFTLISLQQKQSNIHWFKRHFIHVCLLVKLSGYEISNICEIGQKLFPSYDCGVKCNENFDYSITNNTLSLYLKQNI